MYFPTALLTALAAAASWHAAAATPESAPARRDERTTLTLFAGTGFRGPSQSFDLNEPGCVNVPSKLERVSSLTVGSDIVCFMHRAPDCNGQRNSGPLTGRIPGLGEDNGARSFDCQFFE